MQNMQNMQNIQNNKLANILNQLAQQTQQQHKLSDSQIEMVNKSFMNFIKMVEPQPTQPKVDKVVEVTMNPGEDMNDVMNKLKTLHNVKDGDKFMVEIIDGTCDECRPLNIPADSVMFNAEPTPDAVDTVNIGEEYHIEFVNEHDVNDEIEDKYKVVQLTEQMVILVGESGYEFSEYLDDIIFHKIVTEDLFEQGINNIQNLINESLKTLNTCVKKAPVKETPKQKSYPVDSKVVKIVANNLNISIEQAYEMVRRHNVKLKNQVS
jgi:hypothetical protein